MKKFQLFFASLATLAFTAPASHAHTGIGATAGFAHGFSHPLLGLDHLLAMIAVGLWAPQLAQNNKKALWMVPISFAGVMILGGVLGASKIELPLVETGTLMSVLVLGVLVAASARLPLVASIAVVGAFAIFHGHAHGAEMPQAVSALFYGAGFVLATALLHSVGVTLGVLSQKKMSLQITRFAGAAIALCSVMMFLR